MTDDTDVLVLASMIRDASAARGVDRWAIETQGFTASEWADVTGRAASTVQRNVRRARQQ